MLPRDEQNEIRVLDVKKARDRVLADICYDKTNFTIEAKLKDGLEYVNLNLDYSIVGATIESGNMLNLDLRVHNIKPNVFAFRNTNKIMREIRRSVSENLLYLIRTTWTISLDETSHAIIREGGLKAMIRRDFKETCSRHLDHDGMAELLHDMLTETLPLSTYDSIEDIENRDKNDSSEVARIPGIEIIDKEMTENCPLCAGVLSYEDICTMGRRIQYRMRRGRDYYD